MPSMPDSTTAPSLFGGSGAIAPGPVRRAAQARDAKDLVDLLFEGFYLVFLLRSQHAPRDATLFRDRVRQFLAGFERASVRLQASSEDVYLAKFAFTALIDELALGSQLGLREHWELRPLQLELFGEQLAGERFFEHLDHLRQQGAARLQALEVFHMCLLLGFQGRYALEGVEKLNYLTARLGDEIVQLRGKRLGLAPHALAPDRLAQVLRGELPLWVMGSVFACLGLVAYLLGGQLLRHQTEHDLAQHEHLVRLPQQEPHLTITLP